MLDSLQRDVEKEVERQPKKLRNSIKRLENRVERLRQSTQLAVDPVSDFKTVSSLLEGSIEEALDLEEKLELRQAKLLVWRGGDKAERTISDCRARQNELQRRLDAGSVVTKRPISTIQECLSVAEDRITAPAPLNVFVTRFLPALAAILLIGGGSLAGYRVARSHGEKKTRVDGLLDDWKDALEFVRVQLGPLRGTHPDAFDRARLAYEGERRLPDEGDETYELVLAAALDIALRERLGEASSIAERSRLPLLDNLDKVVHLLEENPVEVDGYEADADQALADAQKMAQPTAEALGGPSL